VDPGTADQEGTPVFPSVDGAKPLEEGGPTARIGFNYQDQIACSLLIDMLATPEIVKVHCESHDDAIVIRQADGTATRTAEYVQVKSNEKTWTLTDLCAPKGGKGMSMYETSLAKDQYQEISRFRIVSLRPVSKDLQSLTFPIGAPGRELTSDRFKSLQAYIDGRFPKLQSKKGNGCSYWICNCVWDVRDSEQAICKSNTVSLMKLGLKEGRRLFIDQAQTLVDELLAWAKSAGDARWEPDKAKKIISRQEVREWWERRTQEILDGASVQSGGKLRTKMEEAGIPEDLIRLALELRREYSNNVRTSRYMLPEDTERLQARVKSEAVSLGSQLSAGLLELSGTRFHAHCIERMDRVSDKQAQGGQDTSAFLKGCLYDIADRCLFRFTRRAR
jgi:hypothetical protein